MKYLSILLLGIFTYSSITAQLIDKERSNIRQGNRAFQNEDFQAAAEKYQTAIAENAASQKGLFNLGDALYAQKNFEESVKYFDMAAQVANDKPSRSQAFHNLGNAFMAQEKFKEGIEAYKNALRNNPQDVDTKYNLMYALNKLRQQQQQQQQQNQDQKKDQDQDQQQQNDDQKKQDENQEQDQKDQQEKQDENKNEDGKPQEMKKDPSKAANPMSKEEAEQLLEMLKNQEEKLQEKIQKKKAPKKIPSEKDW